VIDFEEEFKMGLASKKRERRNYFERK